MECLYFTYLFADFVTGILQWVVGMVNDEAWLLGSNQISFHWLKKNTEEEVVLRDNMAAQDWAEDDEGSRSSEPVVQQREKALEVLYNSRQITVVVEKGIETKK